MRSEKVIRSGRSGRGGPFRVEVVVAPAASQLLEDRGCARTRSPPGLVSTLSVVTLPSSTIIEKRLSAAHAAGGMSPSSPSALAKSPLPSARKRILPSAAGEAGPGAHHVMVVDRHHGDRVDAAREDGVVVLEIAGQMVVAAGRREGARHREQHDLAAAEISSVVTSWRRPGSSCLNVASGSLSPTAIVMLSSSALFRAAPGRLRRRRHGWQAYRAGRPSAGCFGLIEDRHRKGCDMALRPAPLRRAEHEACGAGDEELGLVRRGRHGRLDGQRWSLRPTSLAPKSGRCLAGSAARRGRHDVCVVDIVRIALRIEAEGGLHRDADRLANTEKDMRLDGRLLLRIGELEAQRERYRMLVAGPDGGAVANRSGVGNSIATSATLVLFPISIWGGTPASPGSRQ